MRRLTTLIRGRIFIKVAVFVIIVMVYYNKTSSSNNSIPGSISSFGVEQLTFGILEWSNAYVYPIGYLFYPRILDH